MLAYIIRRLLLIIPTLLGIMAVNFLVVQVAPGGPVERLIAQIKGTDVALDSRISGASSAEVRTNATGPGIGQSRGDSAARGKYRGARGLDPELIADIEKLYGFDRPPLERFGRMVWNYIHFDFGDSFFRDQSVISLIMEKLPVSISLGLWSLLAIYLISIPLGIRKAMDDGSPFDLWTSMLIIIGYAVPAFLFAVLLIVLFAGGSFLDWFPLRGLVSQNWSQLSGPDKIIDYFWHIALPVLSLTIGGFAGLTMLTKNSFLEEISKQYVLTARAKGLGEQAVFYRHIFRNAMLIVIAGFPGAFIGILFTGSVLIEIIFSLDGLGLLGFEAALGRDYPVMFATLYIYTLIGLVMKLISDLTYVGIDPRIDFATREG